MQELKGHDAEANRLNGCLQDLSYDAESQQLGAQLAGIKTRIVTLLAQAEQATQTIQVSLYFFMLNQQLLLNKNVKYNFIWVTVSRSRLKICSFIDHRFFVWSIAL